MWSQTYMDSSPQPGPGLDHAAQAKTQEKTDVAQSCETPNSRQETTAEVLRVHSDEVSIHSSLQEKDSADRFRSMNTLTTSCLKTPFSSL